MALGRATASCLEVERLVLNASQLQLLGGYLGFPSEPGTSTLGPTVDPAAEYSTRLRH